MALKIGDKVVIVNYGHLMWQYGDKPYSKPIIAQQGKIYYYDDMPSLVGKKGVVKRIISTQGRKEYMLDGVGWKMAWYKESQLKKITIWNTLLNCMKKMLLYMRTALS